MTTTKTRSKSSKQAAGSKQNPAVNIVGFAPSWQKTPFSGGAENWGMNALHKLAGDRPWHRWYQLHDIDKHHQADKAEHLQWLADSNLPVYMFEDHIEQNPLPNAIPFPREEIVAEFGGYFTNTVSWMIAHAMLEGRKKIGVYGVDMAQDSEYGHQRPSCEYYLGIAEGRGIEIIMPEDTDLLKAPFLYGIEDPHPMRAKLMRRNEELAKRRQEIEGQLSQLNDARHQIIGAQEDVQYLIRAWTMEEIGGSSGT